MFNNMHSEAIMSQFETRAAHPYGKVIEVSRRIRWDIDRDVIRDRSFTLDQDFLPRGLSLVEELGFLTLDEMRLLGQVQGRTYANLFGLVERFIGAKMVELGREHALGDQVAMEALIRFTDEELKHQELFRRIELLMSAVMPAGYTHAAEANAVASAVLGKSTWSVLALTCHIELFTQAHYRASIESDGGLSPLWKDVFRYHWMEESQHAVLDELEWIREDRKLDAAARNTAVGDLIDLVAAVDAILQAQARADAAYFVAISPRAFAPEQVEQIGELLLKAYRWQYIVSGVLEPRFQKVLGSLVTADQMSRIRTALAPLTYAVPLQLRAA